MPALGEAVQWLYLNPATDDLWEFVEHHYARHGDTRVVDLHVRYVPAEVEDDGSQLTGLGSQDPWLPGTSSGRRPGSAGELTTLPALRLTGEAPPERLRALRVELYRRAMSFVHAHDVRGSGGSQ